MPRFGKSSRSKLEQCDERIIAVFERVVREFDCSVLEGHRSNERQEQLFAEGKSKLRAGQSKHNKIPSLAIDAAPYPIDWNDRERFHYFAGYVKGVAQEMGVKLRWGGDWDSDWQVSDNNFDDLPHFEIVE